MHAVRSVVTIALLTVLIAGCGSKDGQQKANKPDPAKSADATELVILCGSSFRPPTEQLMADFTKATGIKATYTTGGSEDLLPHVEMKKKGDLYVTHDPYLDNTKKAGAYADHVHVGYVAPVLAVQKGNPKGIKSIDDLTKPDLKVALSNPKYSTCGEMVEALLKKKGIYDAVMKNVGTRLTKGHENLGNHIKMKTVDAVIMWNGVANTYKEHLELVKTPYEYDEEIRVHVIALNYSKQPEAVKKFMAFVREKGQEAFAEKGYVK